MPQLGDQPGGQASSFGDGAPDPSSQWTPQGTGMHSAPAQCQVSWGPPLRGPLSEEDADPRIREWMLGPRNRTWGTPDLRPGGCTHANLPTSRLSTGGGHGAGSHRTLEHLPGGAHLAHSMPKQTRSMYPVWTMCLPSVHSFIHSFLLLTQSMPVTLLGSKQGSKG